MATEEDVKRYVQTVIDITDCLRRIEIYKDENTRKFITLHNLLTFEQKNGRRMTISDLSKITGMALANVSRFLRPLEEQGLVARRREGRTVYLSITAEGEKTFKEKVNQSSIILGKSLSALTDGELTAFLNCSEKIAERLSNIIKNEQQEV